MWGWASNPGLLHTRQKPNPLLAPRRACATCSTRACTAASSVSLLRFGPLRSEGPSWPSLLLSQGGNPHGGWEGSLSTLVLHGLDSVFTLRLSQPHFSSKSSPPGHSLLSSFIHSFTFTKFRACETRFSRSSKSPLHSKPQALRDNAQALWPAFQPGQPPSIVNLSPLS